MKRKRSGNISMEKCGKPMAKCRYPQKNKMKKIEGNQWVVSKHILKSYKHEGNQWISLETWKNIMTLTAANICQFFFVFVILLSSFVYLWITARRFQHQTNKTIGYWRIPMRKKTTNKKKTETGKKRKKSMEMCTKPMKKIRHRINKMNNFGKNNGTSEWWKHEGNPLA